MTDSTLSDHYAQDGLLDGIRHGLAKMGKSVETASADDFALLDEFHVGGRQATEDLLDQLDIGPGDRVLDIGCGLGGAARVCARRFGARVDGIDTTSQYVETGRVLSDWTGLSDRVDLQTGSGLAMPFDGAHFEVAYMLHVGMNIADKPALCAEVHRVLRPGGRFGIYDLMRTGDGEIVFPVPWSTVEATSAVERPEEYRGALEAAGFVVTAERNRRDFALDFIERARARSAEAGGPPPLTIQLLMGESSSRKFRNMVQAMRAGTIAPVEMIARRD